MEVLRRTIEYLQQGGWIMVPLAAASLVLWTLILERLSFLRGLRCGDITIDEVIALLRRGAVCVEGDGLRARLIRNFLARRSGFPQLDLDILRQCAMRERSELGRSLAVIGILVSVAPLLGLLGTVLGMIETFQVISLFGTGNANAMAGGISVALITTEAGLLVAVPGLLLSGVLLQRSSRLTTQLEEDVMIISRVVRRSPSTPTDRRRSRNACVDEREEGLLIGEITPVGVYIESEAS